MPRTARQREDPRSIWNGSISFGLVNIPVKAMPAVEDHDIHFHLMSPDGASRLRQRLYSPDTGEEYEHAQAARGYEVAPGRYVIVTEDELSRLRPARTKSIEITDFVDLADIDPVYYDHTYYLVPQTRAAAKPYLLLHHAMRAAGKVGFAQVVFRGKGYLAAVRPIDDALALTTMHYADEIVPSAVAGGEAAAAAVSDRDLDIAHRLIDALSGSFEPRKYRDEYQERVRDLIERRAAGRKPVEEEAAAEAPERVISLRTALEASLARAQRKIGRRRRPA